MPTGVFPGCLRCCLLFVTQQARPPPSPPGCRLFCLLPLGCVVQSKLCSYSHRLHFSYVYVLFCGPLRALFCLAYPHLQHLACMLPTGIPPDFSILSPNCPPIPCVRLICLYMGLRSLAAQEGLREGLCLICFLYLYSQWEPPLLADLKLGLGNDQWRGQGRKN